MRTTRLFAASLLLLASCASSQTVTEYRGEKHLVVFVPGYMQHHVGFYRLESYLSVELFDAFTYVWARFPYSQDIHLTARQLADAGKDVAAVLRVGNERLIDGHLQKQIVDIDSWPFRPRNHGDLGGEGIGPAHPVDLARVRRPHDPQEQRVARRDVGGQVLGEEVTALGRAAAHPHAANRVRHT